MKAIQFSQPKEIRIIDLPSPGSPGPGEALVRTHTMGICGTDISGYLGKMPFFGYPRIPGHELGLEVLATGPEVSNVKAGDRCSLEPYLNNPDSPTSRRGTGNCCPDIQVLGVHIDGGLRREWICPARKLHPGNALSYNQLALVETLAIGFHAVQRSKPQPGDTVLVVGAGPIGLACLEFLKLMDVTLIVMDMNADRLRFCTEKLGVAGVVQVGSGISPVEGLGALTNNALANVVIDATGSAASMSACLEYAAFAGRVVYVGITADEVAFPHAPVFHRRELTLLASRNALPEDFRQIIDIIDEGKIDTDKWITHRFGFDETPEIFPRFGNGFPGLIKAVIELD